MKKPLYAFLSHVQSHHDQRDGENERGHHLDPPVPKRMIQIARFLRPPESEGDHQAASDIREIVDPVGDHRDAPRHPPQGQLDRGKKNARRRTRPAFQHPEPGAQFGRFRITVAGRKCPYQPTGDSARRPRKGLILRHGSLLIRTMLVQPAFCGPPKEA